MQMTARQLSSISGDDWNGDWKTASEKGDWKRRMENGEWKGRVERANGHGAFSIRSFHSHFPFALSTRLSKSVFQHTPRDARREFELALKRTPGRSLALLDLARACRAAGDSAAARNAYRQLAANWKHADSTVAAVREARAGAR
jgi:hypothetical protein